MEAFDDVVDEEELENGAAPEPIRNPAGVRRPAIAFSTVYSVMKLLRAMFLQRPALEHLGVPAAGEDPLRGQSAYARALEVRAPEAAGSGPLPDEVAIPLMTATQRMLAFNGPADDVIRMQEMYIAAGGLGTRTDGVRARTNAQLVDFKFRKLPGEPEAWHPPLPIPGVRKPQAPAVTLRNLIVVVRDVCLLTVLQLVGMRLGEILSLVGGTDGETGLPRCVSQVRSPSGLLDLYYVEGLTKKGHGAPDPARWLLGASPVGDAAPVAVRALQVLDRIMSPWRELSDDEVARSAMTVSLVGPSMPDRPSTVRRITAHRASTSIANLYHRLIDFSALPDVARNGTDLRRMKLTFGRNIRCPQWRKALAVSVVRIDPAAMEPLRRHFQHVRMATTEGAYVGCDPAFLEDADDVRQLSLNAFLRQRSSGAGVSGGRGGKIIDRQRARIQHMVTADDAAGRDGLAEQTRMHGVRAWNVPHGTCAIFISPSRAACHAAAGNPSHLHDRPDYSLQSPELCASCRNFVIGVEDLDFWRNRMRSLADAAREHAKRGDEGAAREFGRRAAQAAKVLLAAGRRRAAAERQVVASDEEASA